MEANSSGIVILILCTAIFIVLMIYVVLAKKNKPRARNTGVKREIISDTLEKVLSDVELTKKDD